MLPPYYYPPPCRKEGKWENKTEALEPRRIDMQGDNNSNTGSMVVLCHC